MEKTENYELVKVQETKLDGGELSSNVKKVTSLNLEDEKQADMLLAGMSKVDHKLNDEVGSIINCIGYYITEREVNEISEETGEEYVAMKHTLMIFDDKGESHVTGSNSCYMSFRDIVSIKGRPSVEKPLKLEVIKVEAETKGHQFLKLAIVKNK